jgi:DNA/RNA endonuclease YhcR with UshA esterase domain
MIQDRSSEGPYKDGDVIDVGGRVSKWVLNGYSEVKIANVAHAEGRKAAEKNGLEELCFPLLRKIDIQEKEFKELLALAKDMREFITDECLDSRKVVAGDFDAWKKARWIE